MLIASHFAALVQTITITLIDIWHIAKRLFPARHSPLRYNLKAWLRNIDIATLQVYSSDFQHYLISIFER